VASRLLYPSGTTMPSPKDTLETIDPTALTQVAGGKAAASSSSGDNDAVMTALSGILDSLSSIAKSNQSSGFGANEMMLFMMMMQQRNAPQVVSAAPQPSNWTWDANGGYWIVK
jgi:hypothetical protein